MRALFRPFALHAAYTPIETIVFFCILGTLAYFHILSAIKNSYSTERPAVPLPAYAALRGAEWVNVRESVWTKAQGKKIELEQVLLPSVQEDWWSSSPALSNICFRLSNNKECFVHTTSPTRQTMALKPNTRDEFLSLFPPPPETSTSYVALRALTLRFYTLAKKADSIDILLILLGYILMHTTFYLLVTRSYALGSTFFLPLAILSSALLALLLALPIAMALKIPIDPVALSEALPFLVCTVGFDKPLRLARAVFHHPHLELPPSLVPNTTPDPSSGYPIPSTSNNNTQIQSHQTTNHLLKPSPKIITESLSYVYKRIIRDYILEIAVLTVGAYSRVGGLKEVCALAALVLAVDCLLLCTYLAAILGVMVEVRRIQTQRQKSKSTLQSSSRSSSFTNLSIAATNSTTTATILKPSLSRKCSSSQTHLKSTIVDKSSKPESFKIFGWRVNLAGGKSRQKANGKEDPVARLKLLLITSFLILHILNFITPLTPSKHTHHHHSSHHLHPHSAAATTSGSHKKVDIASPSVRGALNALAEALPSSDVEQREVYVKIYPPVPIRIPSTSTGSNSGKPLITSLVAKLSTAFHHRSSSHSHSSSSVPSSSTKHQPQTQTQTTAQNRISLTDPVLSKWLLLMLGLSVLLNGYLLKGIAAGLVGGVGEGISNANSAFGNGTAVAGKKKVVVVVEDDKESESAEEDSVEQNGNAQSVESEKLEAKEEEKGGNASLSNPNPESAATTQTVTTKAPTLPPTLASPIPMPSPATPSTKLASTTPTTIRPLSTLLTLFMSAPRPLAPFLLTLHDEELILLVQSGKVAVYDLERVLSTGVELNVDEEAEEEQVREMMKMRLKADALERAVRVRRALISRASKTQTLEKSDIPLSYYDYSRVLGACCENVIGYIPLPLGIAGPLTIDGELYPIPMATAEGTLVASTSRGCKALNLSGGVTTVLTSDGMTRAPAVEFDSVTEAGRAKAWIDSEEGWSTLRGAFESTSRFAKLVGVKTVLAGRTLFVRFKTETGDAMGMNMISKGSEKGLERMNEVFPTMKVLALSGNYCTDKKPAAVNWIEGRGKSVVAEAVIPGDVVEKVLKTSVSEMVRLGLKKNLVGSAMAGSVGGFNAHAANILTAVFLATGQDPAQNVESSQCMTLFEEIYPTSQSMKSNLLVTVTMPCIEVGTVGGGTVLAPQQAVLDMLGLKGAHPTHPGRNAQRLARVIAAAVMAGELSLMAALASGELVRAHMRHNRSGAVTPAPQVSVSRGEEVEKKEKIIAQTPALLTPASSTSSLPPYSK